MFKPAKKMLVVATLVVGSSLGAPMTADASDFTMPFFNNNRGDGWDMPFFGNGNRFGNRHWRNGRWGNMPWRSGPGYGANYPGYGFRLDRTPGRGSFLNRSAANPEIDAWKREVDQRRRQWDLESRERHDQWDKEWEAGRKQWDEEWEAGRKQWDKEWDTGAKQWDQDWDSKWPTR